MISVPVSSFRQLTTTALVSSNVWQAALWLVFWLVAVLPVVLLLLSGANGVS